MKAIKRALCILTVFALVFPQCAAPVFSEEDSTKSSGTRWLDTLKFPDRDTSVGEDVKDSDIAVYFEGKKLDFIKKPYVEESEIMLPAKELTEKLGYFIAYQNELPIPGKSAGYFGTVNAADMSIVPDSDVAYYDDVPLELPVRTVNTDGDVYVPLYFIQYINGLSVKQNGGEVWLSIDRIEVKKEEEEKIDIEEKVKDLQGENLVSWDKMLENGNSGNPGDPVVSRVVELSGEPFDKAIEIENNTKVEASYYNQKNFSSEIPVSIGDIVVVTGWVRYTYCVDESGFATTHLCIESEGDWTKALMTDDIQVGDKWQKFVFACSMPFNRDTAKVGFKIRVGYNYQHLQFADIHVVNYGKQIKLRELIPETNTEAPLAYRGMEDNALWREEALRRIEKYRKAPVKVVVRNEDGTPVRDADVSVNMTRNEFIFGTEADVHYWTDLNRRYVYFDGLNKYFNGFVLGNSVKPGGDRQAAAYMINYAREHNLYFRGHVMVYDGYAMTPQKEYTQDEIKNMSYDEYYNLMVREIAGRVGYLGDYFQEVELANELPDYRDARGKYGWSIITDLLEAANELLGDGRIKVINSTAVSGQEGGVNYSAVTTNKNTFDSLRNMGVEFNAIGVQGHSSDNQDPVNYYLQVDQLAQGADYLGNAEYDYVCDLERGSDEALHKEACHLRDYLLMFYSHPKATGFTMWGYGDFYHWRRHAPLEDQNWTPKTEAVKYWMELTHDEWMPQLSDKTDENGEYNVRTHRGEYDVTVTVGGKTAKTTLKVTKDGENTVAAVVKDGGIDIDTSERVVTLKEKTKPIDLKELEINDKNLDAMADSLKENKIKAVTSKSGEDVSYLLDPNNKTPWASKDGSDYLIFELAEPRRKGYITLKWPEGEKYIYQLEVSEDGENWEKIAGSESAERNVTKFFYPEKEPKNIKYIRLSGAAGKPVSPISVGVYPVKYYAERN